ncbi:MAG: RHS repeat-associated core domain-containing protein [Acidobacteriota bacterium]
MNLPAFRRLAALGVFLVAATRGFAQEHPNVARGIANLSGDLDSVNPFNGNLSVAILIGQRYPVNSHLSYGLTLVYNSQVWDYEQRDDPNNVDHPFVQALPSLISNAGLGWLVTLGRFNPPSTSNDGNVVRDNYLAPDGSRHTFYGTLHEGETAVRGVLYTRDGSYLRYIAATATANQQIEFPDGTVHEFDAEGYPVTLRDRFGNSVAITYLAGGQNVPASQADVWRIADSASIRVQTVTFKTIPGLSLAESAKVVSQIDVAAFGSSQPATYLFHYDADSVSPAPITGCRNTDLMTMNLRVAELTQIDLPDGTTYRMPTYYPTTPSGPCKSGMLARLTLPTLGSIAWDFIEYVYPTESTTRGFWQRTSGVGTRQLIDGDGATVIGTWTYETAMTAPPLNAPRRELVNTTADPLGNRTVRYFSICAKSTCPIVDELYDYGLPFTRVSAGDGVGRFLSSQIFAPGNVLLRSFYARYERDADPFGSASLLEDKGRFNQRAASRRTVFQEGATSTVADEDLSDFDGYGHYRGQSMGGTFPGSNVRAVVTGYNPDKGTLGQPGFVPWPTASPWVLGTYTFSWESEGGQLLYRSFCFDGSNGYLLGRRVHAANGSNYLPNDLVETNTNDGKGNVGAEKSFGGDAQPVPTDAVGAWNLTCNSSGLSPVYQMTHTYSNGVRATSSVSVGGSSLKVLDQTIDGRTGLASSSRDTAGVATTYSYDGLGRPLSVAPTGIARTTYTYTNAANASSLARVTIAQVSAANATLAERRMTSDALGRPATEEERMPSGSLAPKRTNYNALGWKIYESNQGSITNGTTYSAFDPFGRPGTVTPADSNAHVVSLNYVGTRQVERTVLVATGTTAETAATTRETYDRFSRLYEVREPNGIVTRYGYDAGNRLASVCQNATGTNSCGQRREFHYDNRGLLLWENHPEKDPNVYSLGHDVDYLSFDARGQVLQKIDGANDVTYRYDAAGRLILVRESGPGFVDCTADGGHRCLKTYTYGTAIGAASTGGTDYRKGKMVAASRFNRIGAPFNVTDEVTTAYEYAGAGGRLSKREASHVFGGTAKEGFKQTFTWGELANLASETYPDCITPTLCGASSPRTMEYGLTNGRLTSVTDGTVPSAKVPLANSITYHANGAMASVVRNNGTQDIYGRDPSWMLRPASIATQRTSDGATLWQTGSYSYDGSGNVWKVGSAAFVYDSLSRLTSGTVFPTAQGGGVAQAQTYSFDNYGNINSVTTNGVVRTTTTSASTNRLAAGVPSYSLSGSLTAWSGNSYEYDAFDQMTRMVSGAEDWRYVYDADGERLWSYRVGGGGSLWTLRGLNAQVLREYRAHTSWSTYVDYAYQGSTLLAQITSPATGNTITHLHPDHLGTSRLQTGANASVLGFHAYFPFGEELSQTFASIYTDRMRFTGHERDLANASGSGDDLDYMHARHCSPLTGRFLSFDPIGGNERSPQTWNRYAYVSGNPLKFTDPEGLFGLGVFAIYPANVGADAVEGYGVGYSMDVVARGVGTLYTNTGTSLFLDGLTFRSQLGTASGGPRDSDFGFDFRRALTLSGSGLLAYVDGLVPFVDPLEGLGLYDSQEVGMSSMQVTGEIALTITGVAGAAKGASTLAVEGATGSGRLAAVGRALFRKGGILNSNRYLRLGYGRRGGERVFRAAGRVVEALFRRAHIDIKSLGSL